MTTSSRRAGQAKPPAPPKQPRLRRGSALLTVLWISAALAAVAFSLANTVRGETDRTSTELDELRSYYLAVGAVDRAAIEVLWSAPIANPMIPKGAAWVDYTFPTGVAHVELIPETAKLDVNNAPPEQLGRMIDGPGHQSGGGDADCEWNPGRTGWGAGGREFPCLRFRLFQAQRTSFQEIEELLQVRGVTPEIFYGTYVPVQGTPGPDEPALVRRSGLVDCLSVYGSRDRVDVNTADPAVLAAIGILSGGGAIDRARAAHAVVHRRPGWTDLVPRSGHRAAGMLRREGNSILTIRAHRAGAAGQRAAFRFEAHGRGQVKYMPTGFDSPIHILRWYDTTWSN